MIQQADLSVETHWQKELKQSFTRPEALLDYLQISDVYDQSDFDARSLFAMRVPRPFANLMEKGNAYDPLLLQVLPLKQEFIAKSGFVEDPLEEQRSAVPGLLHKYKSRVLIIFRGGCAVNCRYCFRRHFPYEQNKVNKTQLLHQLAYIKKRPELNEVILSGGDPLMAQDDHIQWFINQLEQIKHIKRLRIHTRLPVVIPSRLTPELQTTLAETRLKVIMVFHINHANEVSPELSVRCEKYKKAGLWLLNQGVLLKGINETVTQQVALSESLFDAHIQPYYLFLFDRVAGASHFEVEEAEALKLYRQMMAELPGFLLPRLAREIGGETSKTPVLPY